MNSWRNVGTTLELRC